MKLKNGDIILGTFKNGAPVRKVQYKYGNGDQYIGQLLRNGNREGNGTLESKIGVYEGPFKNNLKHGKSLFAASNYQLKGEFQKDEFYSGEFTDKNGNKFVSLKSRGGNESRDK